MLPLWLVYLFITLIITLDILLVLGIIIVAAFLVAYVGFNVFTGFIKLMINKLIQDLLEYLKKYIDSKSNGKTADYATGLVDLVKKVYTVLFWLYNILQLGIDVAISLAAVALIVLGMAALAAVNFALLLLLNAYIL